MVHPLHSLPAMPRTHHKHTVSGLLFALLSSATACINSDTPEPDDGSDTSPPAQSLEGTQGSVVVRTPQGSETLAYVVHGGRAIYQGDIDLGPVRELHQRGGAALLGARWTGNVAYYRLSSNLTGTVCEASVCKSAKAVVRDTLDTMTAQLPVDLVEDVNATHSNYILFQYGDLGFTGGSSNAIGMAGGQQTITFSDGINADGNRVMPNTGTLRHETLHALGLWHEQSRHDRDDYIQVNKENCIDPNYWSQYDSHAASADVGPYDFASIMHYSTSTFCLKSGNACACNTMTPKVLGAQIAVDASQGGLSIEDVNTLFRMYGHSGGANEANDAYGTAVATGDFDDDGYEDLAVGVPFENVTVDSVSHPNAGAVFLYKGTTAGPVAWRVLTEQSSNGTITDRAHFGRSLVALDLNADGITDLAVGAPDGDNGAGYVMVFRGTTARGLVSSRMITQSTLGFTGADGDRFGFALAAGPVTGTTRNGHKFDALAIGAPGDVVGGLHTGAAYLVNDYVTGGGGLATAAATRLVPMNTPGAGDKFGSAIAVGDLDGNGNADVVVGAPHHAGDDGGICIYAGTLPPQAPASWGPMATPTKAIRGPNLSLFGTALAIGNVLTAAGKELVVGAPGGAGQVNVMTGGLAAATAKVLTEGSPETGDEFGAALAIGNFDPASQVADLVVGAPGENASTGAILLFLGGSLTSHLSLFQSDADPDTSSEQGDRFGAAVALGQLDGRGPRGSIADVSPKRLDLVIGVPGETLDSANGAGAITLMRGNDGTTPTPWKTIAQEFDGRL